MKNKILIKKIFKKFNKKLLLSIILFSLIPTIYKTTRIFFIGSIDDGYNYSIASQIQWLNIIYEIITEAIVVPCFFVLSSLKFGMDNKKTSEHSEVITILTLIVFSFFFMFSIIIFSIIKPLLDSVNNDAILVEKSLNYIRMEVWSIFLHRSHLSLL